MRGRIVQKLRRLAELDDRQLAQLAEAYLTLGVMRAAIEVLPFKTLTRELRRHEGSPALRQPRVAEARAIGDLIRIAAANTPWESVCLVQALTAQRLLKRRAIPGALFIGARLDDSPAKALHAHAWVQCGDEVITGEAGHEHFAVLSAFSWE